MRVTACLCVRVLSRAGTDLCGPAPSCSTYDESDDVAVFDVDLVVEGDVTIRCFHLANARNHMPISIMVRSLCPSPLLPYPVLYVCVPVVFVGLAMVVGLCTSLP